MRITLELAEKREISDLVDKDLDMSLKVFRNKRSLQANRMMWACIGELAAAMRSTKDEIHDIMLQRYGSYSYQVIKPYALDRIRMGWEGLIQELGPIHINGTEGLQILMIYPSRYYDTKEFSRLLDGILDEMRQSGLETPEEARIREAMEEYERVRPWESQSSKKKNTA